MDRRSLFIAAFLGVQALLPLHYYLLGKDHYDERFAWRMFSDVRMLRCEGSFAVGGRPVDLAARFHSAWITLLERGRSEVIGEMGQRLCETAEAPVHLSLSCREADGRKVVVEDGRRDLCEGMP